MILISLIGEQPIPNLIPLWQHPKGYTATRFAVSDATQDVGELLAQAIANDLQLHPIRVLPPISVRAYDIAYNRTRLNEAITRHVLENEEITINLTGGTKIMSLAALQAAYGSGVPLLYVSTETSEIIHFASDGAETGREPIDIHISVKQYLAAHGIEASLHPSFNDQIGRPPYVPKEGDDLERQVYDLASKSAFFDDVQRNLFIRKNGRDGFVTNELDLVVICQGRLAVCSCKSGKNITNDDIYELTSLSRRESAGIYCGKVLVSALDELPTGIKERAHESGVRLVYGDKLKDVAETLQQALR